MEHPLPSPHALSKGIFQHSKKAFGVGAILGAITGVLLSGSKSPSASPDTAEDLLTNTVKTSLLGGVFAFIGATVHGAMQSKASLKAKPLPPKRNPPPDFSLN
jgi:branched-subunit amino acid ABC-type transport system permease component